MVLGVFIDLILFQNIKKHLPKSWNMWIENITLKEWECLKNMTAVTQVKGC